MTLVLESAHTGVHETLPMTRRGPSWEADVVAHHGDRYWLVADGVGPLVDPSACDVLMTERGPVGVVRDRPWPSVPPLGRRVDDPVVYELHVRGFARTFADAIERLPYLRDLGIDVIEVMPIHPFDTTDNYWGYMPIVWGAVHRPYADGDDPAAEFARFVAAAHDLGIAVWVDVVFNHTGEGDASMPTWSLRGLDDAHAYRHHPDGRYVDDSGCGNDIDPSDEHVRRLVMEALAALRRSRRRRVPLRPRLVAHPRRRRAGASDRRLGRGVGSRADRRAVGPRQLPGGRGVPGPTGGCSGTTASATTCVGSCVPSPASCRRWCSESPAAPTCSATAPRRTVNFLTAHDGLTLHDLTTVTSDRHRSWDCGAELRPQQLANACCLLLLSAGTAMFVMGDEFGRTQLGHDNPYDVDSELTWVDWSRLDEWRPLHDLVARAAATASARRLRQRAVLRHRRCARPGRTSRARSRGARAG